MFFHLFRLNFETVAKLQLSNRLPHIPNTYGLAKWYQNTFETHCIDAVLIFTARSNYMLLFDLDQSIYLGNRHTCYIMQIVWILCKM